MCCLLSGPVNGKWNHLSLKKHQTCIIKSSLYESASLKVLYLVPLAVVKECKLNTSAQTLILPAATGVVSGTIGLEEVNKNLNLHLQRTNIEMY